MTKSRGNVTFTNTSQSGDKYVLSPHIKKLVDVGYDVEIVADKWLIVKRIPYLNKDLEVHYGSIVSGIEMEGNEVKVNLNDHTVYFIGEQPYRIDGAKLNPNNDTKKELYPGLEADFYYSYKLNGRLYSDYYEKMSHYVHIFSKHAIRKDPSFTFNVGSLTIIPDNYPFQYSDCNSASPECNTLLQRFLEMKIGIIGLGGTGSYILDYISKIPVKEIHLFDGDYLHNKNAFRSPGAVSIESLVKPQKKTDYYKNEYGRIHKNIISHSEYLKPENLNLLDQLTFVFISIDKSGTILGL